MDEFVDTSYIDISVPPRSFNKDIKGSYFIIKILINKASLIHVARSESIILKGNKPYLRLSVYIDGINEVTKDNPNTGIYFVPDYIKLPKGYKGFKALITKLKSANDASNSENSKFTTNMLSEAKIHTKITRVPFDE